MSSTVNIGGQPATSQKVVGAVFFILPVAFIVVFLCWCWGRHHRSFQEERWTHLISVIRPRDISLESLPTVPELHSAHLRLEDGRVKRHWSDIKVRTYRPICSSGVESNNTQCHKPVYVSFRTDSLPDLPESSSGPTTQVCVLIRMPSREPTNTSECAHLRGAILLGLTNSLHVPE
jgi:hypothetical protein